MSSTAAAAAAAADAPALEEWQVESGRLKKLGDASFALKEYVDAITCYSSALEMDPDNHVLYSNRCACHQAAGNKSKVSARATAARDGGLPHRCSST
jgi:tetratricopeptide (TPR) repeat protein